jgi:hypothetical protein
LASQPSQRLQRRLPLNSNGLTSLHAKVVLPSRTSVAFSSIFPPPPLFLLGILFPSPVIGWRHRAPPGSSGGCSAASWPSPGGPQALGSPLAGAPRVAGCELEQLSGKGSSGSPMASVNTLGPSRSAHTAHQPYVSGTFPSP